MNQLSWLLYLGNVAQNIGGAFIFFGICMVIWAIVQYCTAEYTFKSLEKAVKYRGIDEVVRELKKFKTSKIGIWFAIICTLIFWTLAIFCPNSNTVYAIAASEVGGKALTSPLAQKTEKALEVWLDKQIKPENKE